MSCCFKSEKNVKYIFSNTGPMMLLLFALQGNRHHWAGLSPDGNTEAPV